MLRLVAIAAKALLWLVVAICLVVTCVPPFLDRIYYRGPPSGHFTGARFFNPDGDHGTGGSQRGAVATRVLRFTLRRDRTPWPEQVPVTPGYPPAAATPCAPTTGAVIENWRRCVPRVDPGVMAATWVGHATVLVQTGGLAILTDPIWSDHATPLPPIGPKRVRAPGIRFDDLPKIDVVLVSHNHYDHLDIPTLKRLWVRDRPLIVTSLGNDAVLRAHGIPAVARDWGGQVPVRPGVAVIVERVHHWSSRWGADRNRALWSGFTVTLPGGNLFFAGDTGFGDGSWADAAARHGPVRLALLPIGAYRPREMMSGNHIGPVEAVEVFRRTRAAHALAIHWGTFPLANEAVDDPPRVLAATLRQRRIAPNRFRAIEVGRPWLVPALP